MTNKKNGFTLAELLATIVILGIIVLIAVPAYTMISNNVKRKQNENKISYIETQAAKYATESGLYSDVDETSITVQTLLQNGYIDGDNKVGDIVEDIYGKDITCYQIKISFEKGKPIPEFIDKDVLNQDGVCMLNDLQSKKVLALDAYSVNNLNENNRIEVKNNRTQWVSSDVVLKLKINDAELNAKRDQAIINIGWNAVNNNKVYSQTDDNWYTTGWLDNIANYNSTTDYKNIYTVSTNKIMADTKFKITVIVNYIDTHGKRINETLTTYLIVRIDKELPTVKATVDSNWTKGDKKIYITGNDKQGSGINHFCIFDSNVTNHTCGEGDAAYVPVINEGSNKGEVSKPKGTYYVWAVDNVGNYSQNYSQVTVDNIDTTKPTCVYENQNSTWKTGALNIKVKCDDGSGGSGCITKPYTATFPNNQTYSSTNLPTSYIITDYAGNKTVCSGPVNVYIDNNAPVVNKAEYSKGVTTIKVSDTGELDKYEIIKDGSVIKTVTLSGTSSTTKYSNATAGSYKVKVYDKVGHTKEKDFTIPSYTVTCQDYFVDASNNRKVKLGNGTKQYNYGATASGADWGTDTNRIKYYAGYVYQSATTATVADNNDAVVYRYFYAWTDLNILFADGTSSGGTVSLKVGNGSWKTVNNEDGTVQPWGTTYYIKNITPYHNYEELNTVGNLTYDSSKGYYTYTPTVGNTAMVIKFKYITYTITYNLNGGTIANSNPTTYTYNSNDITLNNPTRSNYTFLGWTGSNGSTPQKSVKITKGSTGNKTYTANWKQNLPSQKVVATGKVCNGTGNNYTCNDSSYGLVLNSGCDREITVDSNYITGTTMANTGSWYQFPSGTGYEGSDTKTFTINFNGYTKATVIVGGTYNSHECTCNHELWYNDGVNHHWKVQGEEYGCWVENGSRKCSCRNTSNTTNPIVPMHTEYIYTSNGTGSKTITIKAYASKPGSDSWSNSCIVIEKIVLSDPA